MFVCVCCWLRRSAASLLINFNLFSNCIRRCSPGNTFCNGDFLGDEDDGRGDGRADGDDNGDILDGGTGMSVIEIGGGRDDVEILRFTCDFGLVGGCGLCRGFTVPTRAVVAVAVTAVATAVLTTAVATVVATAVFTTALVSPTLFFTVCFCSCTFRL